jgi:hypothetical protein
MIPNNTNEDTKSGHDIQEAKMGDNNNKNILNMILFAFFMIICLCRHLVESNEKLHLACLIIIIHIHISITFRLFGYYGFLYLPTYLLLIAFIYFLIIKHNPFFHFFTFWLPCQDFWRMCFMYELIHRFFENRIIKLGFGDSNLVTLKLKESLNSLPTGLLHSSFINLSTTRKKLKWAFFFLFIKIIFIIYDEYFAYLQIDKSIIRSKKYFIAANLFNNENIFIDWKKEMLKLIDYIGPEYIHGISIFENGDSTDNTANMLIDFKLELDSFGIRNFINTEKRIDKKLYERIVFLSLIRQQALEPIYTINNLNFN